MPTLAPTLYNPGSRGQDARYDIRGLPQVRPGVYSDGRYEYDSNGLDLSGRVPDWSAAKPADQMDAEGSFSRPQSGSLLAGDATYNQMLQDLRAQSISDKAQRDAAIKKSFINFGLGNFDITKAAQSTGIGELAQILDPQTLELARNNQFSAMKRLEQVLADRQRENRVSLRQRGGVRSGESGFLAQRSQREFDTDVYDSTQKLLDYISGAQSSFAAAEQERKRREFEAAMLAAQRASQWGGGYDGGGEQYNEGLAPDRAMPGLAGVQDWLNQAMAGFKAPKVAAPTTPKFTYAGTTKAGKPYARRGGI